jgi:Mrp family chromosome partitioning ATPase
MSNKGGVGKTTVSIALAYELARRGMRVALVDIDFHGPTMPIILGAADRRPEITMECIRPVEVDGVKVMSLHYLLRGEDDPVLWPGEIKRDMVRQLVDGASVCWGEYDVMVVDSPPSMGDENMTLMSLVDKVVVVTTPHPASVYDIRKLVRALRLVGREPAAIVVNMADMFEGKLPDLGVPVIEIPYDRELQRNPRRGGPHIKRLADILLGNGGGR